MYHFNIRKVDFFPNNPLVLIAGPCVIESEKHCLFMAEKLKNITERLNIPFVFKSSFLKANRTSLHSFVGPGLLKGLEILMEVKSKYSIPILSDIHSIEQVKSAAEVLDIIQIPAFLCRQTDLIIEASKTSRIINVKKGQFIAPGDVKNIVEKISSTGNKKILITERGTTFGYHNLVVDFRSLEIIKKMGIPVVFDATHSVQLPGAGGNKSSGQREFVFPIARAAVATGINALFMEIHDNPAVAKSDGPNMLSLKEVEEILPLIINLDRFLKEHMYGKIQS